MRPFRIAVEDTDATALRQRLARTRWPEPQTVADWSQGVPRQYLVELCDSWVSDYDWRATEHRLNRVPQVITAVHWGEPPRGGHFAAWEQPHLFLEGIRAASRACRGSRPAR